MTFFIDTIIPKSDTKPMMLTIEPLVVGRAYNCNIVIDDPYVSGRHMELWEGPDKIAFVRDTNSSNGTSLNGNQLNPGEPVALSNGDHIEMADGKAVIVVSEDSSVSKPEKPISPPEGTVTFLFTDIVGSTNLVRDLGDIRSRDLFHAHDDILRNTITQNRGFIVKEQGDGFMAAFQSSRSAIISATGIQQSIANLRDKEPDLSIYLRIGINTGEAILENNDYFGRAVNEAARISAHAGSDEILISSTSKTMADSAGDIVFGDYREIQLKGLPGTHVVHPVIWKSGTPDTPTEKT